MHTYYFTTDGTPFTDHAPSGEEQLAQGNAIKTKVPEDILSWRLSYDVENEKVIVRYEGMSEDEAHAQCLLDIEAEEAAFRKEVEDRITEERLQAARDKAAVEAIIAEEK